MIKWFTYNRLQLEQKAKSKQGTLKYMHDLVLCLRKFWSLIGSFSFGRSYFVHYLENGLFCVLKRQFQLAL